MTKYLSAAAFAALMLGSGIAYAAQSGDLKIAWIDVEGGAATLFVAPTGESLLFDTGYEGNGDRDAKRILDAAKKAGLTKIDHLVISHWHGDHVGGLAALSKLIPIGKFYDHGDGVEPADRARIEGYKAIAGANRTILKAGDTIPFGPVQIRVLVSEGPVIATPVNGGGPNPNCANAPLQAPGAPENIRMVGLSVTYNNFKYAGLSDADWSREMELACPVNKLGRVNLYLTNRHGGLDNSGAPALLNAIQPQVVMLNNGPRKGLGQKVENLKILNVGYTPYETNSFLRYAKLPGIEGIWQGHKSLIDPDPAHNTAPDMIANLEEGAGDQGNAITATVAADGKFTITNTRNNFSKTYQAK